MGVKRRMWTAYLRKWGSTDPLDLVAPRPLFSSSKYMDQASLTTFAYKRQQHITLDVSHFVVPQRRARIVLLPITVDPRAPVNVVVVLELCHQLTELTLVTLRIARPRQDGTVVLSSQSNTSIHWVSRYSCRQQ